MRITKAKMKWKTQKTSSPILCLAVVAAVLVAISSFGVTPVNAETYTLDADFDLGTLINVDHSPSDQLQLDDTTTPFEFIWVAVSSKGTVVKIDTNTGVIEGEYRTTPQSQGAGNPSRTTVDLYGNEGPMSLPVSSDHVRMSSIVDGNGGVLAPTTGTIRLEIPAGALDAPIEFTIEQVPSPPEPNVNRVMVTRGFEVTPHGTTFDPPATLTLIYDIPAGAFCEHPIESPFGFHVIWKVN